MGMITKDSMKNLESITTDIKGVTLERDVRSGSLYLLDGGERKQILDQGGWEPQLEYSEYWIDGSYFHCICS